MTIDRNTLLLIIIVAGIAGGAVAYLLVKGVEDKYRKLDKLLGVMSARLAKKGVIV